MSSGATLDGRTKLYDRRAFATLLAGGVALAATSRARGAALEQTSVEIGGVRDPQLGAQLAIAAERDLFKAQGLNATVHWTESGVDIMSLMTGRAVPVATGGANSQIMLTSLKAPVKTICALSNSAATQGIVLSAGLKLTSPKQLMGKRLASPLSSPHIMMLAKLAKEYDFDLKKIKLVFMEPSDAVVAVMRGDVDGALTYDPFMYTMVQNGATLYATGTTSYVTGKKQVLPANDQLLYQHSVFLAQENWISEKPNTLKAIVRALIQANSIINSNRAEAVQIMAKFLHIDQKEMASIMLANTYGVAIDQPLVRSLEFASRWLLTAHKIKTPISPEMVLAPEILESIDPRLVTWKA